MQPENEVSVKLFATNYLTTELAHSKLKYGLLAELLAIMTDQLKIVRIHARNVPHIHGHDDDAFLAYVGVPACQNTKEAVVLKHKRNRL